VKEDRELLREYIERHSEPAFTELNSDPPSAWEAMRPLLEAAVQRLEPVEQDALILRYFEGKSLRQAV